MMVDEDSKALELDILTTEYKARRDEILMLSQRYGRFMIAVISSNSIIIAVGRMVAGPLAKISGAGEPSTAWAPIMLLVAVPALAYYLMASTMDALYMLQLNGLRCGELEKAINRIAGKRLLAWETGVMSDMLWAMPGKRMRLWVQPNVMQALFLVVLMLVANGVLTALVIDPQIDFMGTCASWSYVVVLWVTLVLLITQWLMLLGPVRQDLSARIAAVSSHLPDAAQPIEKETP